MKSRLVMFMFAGMCIAGCHKKSDDVVVSPLPTWKLRTDIFLDNKILLGAQATDKRLIVAHTGGFLMMQASDSLFATYSDGNISQSPITVYPDHIPSLFKPILTNSLYVGLSSERNLIAPVDLFSTVDSIATYEVVAFRNDFDISYLTDIPNAQANVYSPSLLFSSSSSAFGSYNELTRTLLYSASDSKIRYGLNSRIMVMNKTEDSPYFGFHRGLQKSVYRTDSLGFGLTGSIAVKDYFIISPKIEGGFPPGDVYMYAVSAKYPLSVGGVKKIPVNFNPPDSFFFYKNHLYGYSSNASGGITAGQFVRSDDGGFTWRLVANFSEGLLSFTTINGSLIAYGGFSRVFWLDDGSETFTHIRELTNDGLELSQITGIAAFRNKVFATTLSGLYAIDSKDFFTVKPK